MSARPAVLVIAGSDSSGGAGLARDIRALEACGADALPVVTAVTAQSDRRVVAIHPVPPAVIRSQIEAAVETRMPDAVKIGMLVNRETVEAVAEALRALVGPESWGGRGRRLAAGGRGVAGRGVAGRAPIVLDPVLVSSSGGVLLDEGGRRALKERLLPLTALLTPNIPEAAVLLDEVPAELDSRSAASGRALDEFAHRLLDLGPRAVLLKGGHSAEPDAIDRLVCRGEPLRRLTAARIRGSQRGTGCALASAAAAQLAAGVGLEDACRRAQAYIHEGLRAAAAV